MLYHPPTCFDECFIPPNAAQTVMSTQFRSELRLDQARIEEFAQRLYAGVRAEVPEYETLADPELDRDFADVNRRNVEIFFRSLAEDRPPSAAELALLAAAARRRRNQAVPLEAIFHSYRVGVRLLWECLLEIAPQQDHGRLAVLALDYSDRVSTAAAQAYVEERQRVVQSRQDAARLLLTRIITLQAADEVAVLREAAELGLDFTQAHVALVAAGTQARPRPSTESDLVLAQVQARLTEAVPEGLAVLLSAGLVAVVPAASAERAEEVLSGSIDLAHPFVVGLGTAGSGVAGLATSYREAVRARALGGILHPDRLLHRYADLRLFDLFKEGETMDAFVREVLGPLLGLDPGRRQRLTDSLNAIFNAALNRKLAARRLGVHQNTLGHRIRRIEALLGGSLDSGEFCFRVQLALRLLPLTLGSSAG